MINIITGNINVQQGNVIVGNVIGDNANFSHNYNNRLIELPKNLLETQIQISPKNAQ
jgi:hypothetical protein